MLRYRVIHVFIQFINGALGGLFQLMRKSFSRGQGQLVPVGGEGGEARIVGLLDVGGLQELEIRVGGILLEAIMVCIQPPEIQIQDGNRTP
jgi:hypothetical protein